MSKAHLIKDTDILLSMIQNKILSKPQNTLFKRKTKQTLPIHPINGQIKLSIYIFQKGILNSIFLSNQTIFKKEVSNIRTA